MQGQLRFATSPVLVVGFRGRGCPLASYLRGQSRPPGPRGLRQSRSEQPGPPRAAREGTARHTQGVWRHLTAQPPSSGRLRALRRALRRARPPASALRDAVPDCPHSVPPRDLAKDRVCQPRPLLSASALWTSLWWASLCCVFPQPPPAETVTSYALGRVFAVVTGVLGRRQALGVRMAAGLGPSCSGSVLLFRALGGHFRCVQLRRCRPGCAAGGDGPLWLTCRTTKPSATPQPPRSAAPCSC